VGGRIKFYRKKKRGKPQVQLIKQNLTQSRKKC
jgi:hypothetical protein